VFERRIDPAPGILQSPPLAFADDYFEELPPRRMRSKYHWKSGTGSVPHI
jgi:hypothetical protein